MGDKSGYLYATDLQEITTNSLAIPSIFSSHPFTPASSIVVAGMPLDTGTPLPTVETVVLGENGLSLELEPFVVIDDASEPNSQIDPLTGLPHELVSSGGSLDAIRQAAIAQWSSLDLSAEQLEALESTPLRWDELPGTYLGLHSSNGITLDIDAAGQGWFVDSTPWESSEFSIPGSSTELRAEVSDAPFGAVDLLTVVTHELGHAIGLDHPKEADGETDYVMNAETPTGVRRLADPGDLEFAHEGEWQHLVQANRLPPNRQVIDISTTGQIVQSLQDRDDHSVSVDLPFSFTFYGQAYTEVGISTNGIVTFDGNRSSYSNTSLTNFSGNPSLFPFWDDLDARADDINPRTGEVIDPTIFTQTIGPTGDRQFIIQWNEFERFFYESETGYITFQVVLTEKNEIFFHYLDMNFSGNTATEASGGGSATVGIWNSSSEYKQYSFNESKLFDGLSLIVTEQEIIETISNINNPRVVGKLDNQNVLEDNFFNITISNDIFEDVNGIYDLTYTAALADDSPLPDWLNFDSESLTLSGTPIEEDEGTISIAIKAIDGSGATGAALFDLTVELKLADLIVSSVNWFGSVISPGNTTTVGWTVINQGPGKAREDWVDAIYLSASPELDRDTAIRLREVSVIAQTPLEVTDGIPHTYQDQYTMSAGIAIPADIELGDYYLFVVADDRNEQPEVSDDNNTASIAITVGAPDLVVESVNVPETFAVGQPTPISWSVQNTGNSATQVSWSDRLYLSDSPDFDPQSATPLDTLANPIALGVSADDNAYTQEATITLTDISPGTKYLFIITDGGGNQGETDETNNVFSTQITVVTADLEVVATDVPADVALNQPTQVSWTVENIGEGPAQGSWTDRVYLSDSPTLNASAVELQSTPIAKTLGIPGEANEYTQTAEILISGSTTGTKYLLFVTDDRAQQTETNESNNVRAVEITLTAPDLKPSLSAPGTVTSGDRLSIDWSVENIGTASTPDTPWVTHFYWSETETLEPDAVPIETVTSEMALAPTAKDFGAFSLDLPLDTEGQYYLIMVTDVEGAVAETNASNLAAESNNTIIQPITVELAPYSDLAVTAVTAPEQEIDDPARIEVTWEVSNLRNEMGRSQTWVDRIWASEDAVLGNADDYILSTYTHTDGLDALERYTRTETLTFGPGFSDDLQIWVETGVALEGEATLFENGATRNNIKAADHRTHIMPIPYADLVVDGITVDSEPNSGQLASVSWTVANNGIGITNTSSWQDSVYLTTDPAGQTGRLLLGQFNHAGVLAPDQAYERTAQVQLPDGLEGDYYFVVRTGGPYEFIYTRNNTFTSEAVDVMLPPAPDLVVNAIDVFGATDVETGSKFDIAWTVENQGDGNPNRTWRDRVYLQTIDGTETINLGTFTYTQGLEPGKTYTRSEQFTVPNIQGTYHIVVETNNGETLYEGDAVSNNVFFDGSQVLTVSFPPRADLRVAEVVAPDSVLAGNPLNVSFIVENQGAVSTSESNPTSNWVDRIYLSLDDTIDGSDILLGELTNSAALGAGEQYQTIDIETALIPRYFRGEAYIVAQTDATNRVDEFPQDGNNTRAHLVRIDPLPPADLVTSAVTAPSQAFDGTTIDVSYTVTNKGAGETDRDRWEDTVWLTRDKNRPSAFSAGTPPKAEDILLGTFYRNGSLTVNGGNSSDTSYTKTVQVALPDHVSGEWYITVWSDALDLVTEDTTSDNVNPDDPNELHSNNYSSTPISVLLTPPPDLVVSSITATPTAKGGDPFSVSWTVENNGSTAAKGRWYDEVYISTSETLNAPGSQRWYLGRVDRSQTLASGDRYTAQLEVDLAPAVQGQYVIVETNVRRTAWEGSDGHPHRDNNISVVATDVTREAADLVVSAVTATDADSGEWTTVEWTVTNEGADVWEGTDYWYDEVWVSPDPTFIQSRATRVGFFVHNADQPLQAGESYTQTQQVRLPAGIDGEYYVHVSTDYSHNRNTSKYRGNDFDASTTYTNDNVLKQLGYSVFEDPNNNLGSGTLAVTYREPDLTPTFTATASADSGDTITVSWTVTNAGGRDTRQGSWNDRIYLSSDPSLDIHDVMLASVQRKGILESGDSYTKTTDIRLPDGIEGEYYLIFVTDANLKPNYLKTELIYDSLGASYRQYATVPEFQDEGNNVVASSLQVTLTPPPDLQVTILEVPEEATVGQLLDISYTVSNEGLGATPDRQNRWQDFIYLSRDEFLDVERDRFLGSVSHGSASHEKGLAAGASYDISKTFDLPTDLEGAYYVFVLTDASRTDLRGSVFEGGFEGNNATSSRQPVELKQAPPSDLQVSDINIPASAQSGQPITVEWTVTNTVDNPAKGRWSDALYLSADDQWDIDDIPLAQVQQTGMLLEKDKSYTASLEVDLPPAIPGEYRIIVRPDIFDQIYEQDNEANNITASDSTLMVTVESLQLGVPLDIVLDTGEEQLFEITVDAGQTLA
ncbi:MAG: hypothetical protein F6K30_10255 [Cyanothece sp. SIO2G6]|nr:hypothetical protein [Cyanothece sp. SIO2G6]